MTVAPTGKFWLNDSAFEKCKTDIAAILGGNFARVLRETWG
jgi:microsomal dipeptidase-like Zn-dependent dipeptidase